MTKPIDRSLPPALKPVPRAYVQAEIRKRWGVERDVKFDVIAHSMGSLIARDYLMFGQADLPVDGSVPRVTWAGLRYVDRTILVGTPNAGSVDALLQLVEGRNFGPFLPRYAPAIVGTFPSVYQLLPRSRHGALVWSGARDAPRADVFNAQLWERLGWGLS